MKEKLIKNRNIAIVVGFSLTLVSLSRFSIEGLGALTFFTRFVGILAFLTAYKTNKEIIENDKN